MDNYTVPILVDVAYNIDVVVDYLSREYRWSTTPTKWSLGETYGETLLNSFSISYTDFINSRGFQQSLISESEGQIDCILMCMGDGIPLAPGLF